MNKRLEDDGKKYDSGTAEEAMLADLRRQLKQAVPEIAESIRQREELAFELRISASKTVKAEEEKRG